MLVGKSLAEQVREMRERLGINKSELARLANMSPSQIVKWETGPMPFRASSLERIADALECDVLITLIPRDANESSSANGSSTSSKDISERRQAS